MVGPQELAPPDAPHVDLAIAGGRDEVVAEDVEAILGT